jgi:hypothetical protein
MLLTGTLVFVFVMTSTAWAATTDCIAQGGERLCTEPVLKSEKVSLCSETAPYNWISYLEQACGWRPDSVYASVSDIISKVNCFENGVTGCSGTQTQFPGWSSPGQSYSSWNCWNVTTTTRNGYVLNQFASLRASTTTKDSQGNCTQTNQPFPIRVVALLYRDVSCPNGWNTTTLSNGDYECWRCPDNSRPNGTRCVCNSGFVKDPSTKLCVPACPNDQACDDQNFCNGVEKCVAGLCQPGTAQTCDDGIQCTVDTCSASQNQCINRPEPLLCRCDTIDVPDVTHELTKSVPLLEVECPLIGDKASASIDISSKSMGKEASCYNNCEASSSGDASVTLKASVCGASGEVTGTGKSQYKATHCLECGPGCIQTCGKGACIESGGSGSVSLSTERRFKGLQKTFKGPVGIEFKCGGTWGGSLTTEVGYQSTEDAGSCMNCPDCSKLTSTLAGSANATLSCSFKAPGNDKGSGCLGCASLSATETGGATGQWGACGSESCPMVKVDVEGALKAKVAFSFGWWHVEGECAAKLSACSEANACGTCSCEGCRDVKSDFHSCKVTSTTKLQ